MPIGQCRIWVENRLEVAAYPFPCSSRRKSQITATLDTVQIVARTMMTVSTGDPIEEGGCIALHA